MNPLLLLGALLGFSSILFGAAIDHVMKGQFNPEALKLLQVGLHYQQLHAIVIVVIALTFSIPQSVRFSRYLLLAGWLFVLGVFLFCFSLYLAALTGVHQFVTITPSGGFCLMVAWLVLALASLSKTQFRT